MGIVTTIKTILEADATLTALATGGIYDMDEAGAKGINRTLTPSAFDGNGIIKPSILIRLRSSTPDPALQDDSNQYIAVREVVEVYLFQDSGYSTIDGMRARVYALLHAKRLSNTFRVEWAGDVRTMRDNDLDSSVERADYLSITWRSVS